MYEYKKAKVYSNGKSLGKIKYTKIKDPENPGYAKMLINLQEIADISRDNGCSFTIAYDLGDLGGTFRAVSRSFASVSFFTNQFVPNSVAKDMVITNVGTMTVDAIEDPNDPTDVLTSLLASIAISPIVQKQFEEEVSKNNKFIHLSSYSNYNILGSSKSDTFKAYNNSYFYPYTTLIGVFEYGEY